MAAIKTLLFEIVIAVPLIYGICFLGLKWLSGDLKIKNPLKAAAGLTVMSLLILAVGRTTPVIAYKYIMPLDPATAQAQTAQLKTSFLAGLDSLANNQSQITPENIKKLFADHSALFPNGKKERQIYFDTLYTYIDCNQEYFEDAMRALKSKSNQKSAKRQQCQQFDGIFFNRQLLIPSEQAQVNDQVIATIAKGKKIIQDGKELEVNEGILQQNIESYMRNKEVLKTVFAGVE